MAFNAESWTQDLAIKLSAADADSVIASGTYAAGYIPLNGALATETVAQLPAVGAIAIASTGNLSAINFVITGITLAGATITETLAGPNNNSVTSALNTYWRITSIVPSATSASTVNIGIAGSVTAITNAGAVTANTAINITSSTFASATSITFVNPALMSLTAAANESANTFTIYGQDVNGTYVTTTLTGPNATVANATVAFSQIIWISQANAGTGNITAGNATSTYSAWVPIDKVAEQFAIEFGVGLSSGAVLNYTVQFAVRSRSLGVDVIQNDSILVNETTGGTTYLFNEPFDAARLYINSYTSGTAYFLVRPSGLRGAGVPTGTY